MTELLNASEFLIKARRKMRFGTHSRLPVKLLRLEWTGTIVKCDWLMRPADPWDKLIPEEIAEEHQTLQALEDALTLRDLVFAAFPEVTDADLRMFRKDANQNLELLLTGTVNRLNEVLRRVPSITMRARLCGFHFTLASGVLERMSSVSIGCI